MLHFQATSTFRRAPSTASPIHARRPGRILTATLSALFAVLLVAHSNPSATAAEPTPRAATDFKGVNWAMPGDNFVDGPVVPEGLSESDDYETVKAKAAAVYDGFQSTIGANTVRLPINTYSVPGTTWGDAYAGAVDAATEHGFNVILSYWEDGASSGGRVVDTEAFNAMWDSVTTQWESNSQVYFEPMNEPHGYSAEEWADLAAGWIADRPSIPKDRIFVSGVGYNQDVTPLCGDSRFDGTYLSIHFYTFFNPGMDYNGWVDLINSQVGDCGTRTVADEFGAPMDDGRDYNDANSTDEFVQYIRAITDTVRSLGMGAVYWPALGGKHTERPDYDWYSLYALNGSGTDLTLSLRNTSIVDRLQHAWGIDSSATID